MPKHEIQTTQGLSTQYHIAVTDTAGTPSLAGEGKNLATITDNGTGDYTITLNKVAKRALHVVGALPLVANLQAQIVSVSTSAVRIKFTNNSGTAVDTGCHLTIQAFYAIDHFRE